MPSCISHSSRCALAVFIAAGSLAAPDAFAHTLSGRVSDASGVQSLNSAEVEVIELGRRTRTGADGMYRFTEVPDGVYTLRVRYVGADPAELTVTVNGDTRHADVRLGEGADYIDNVLVVGQRASLASALSRQRAADGVQSVLTRDGIGQFPDQNAAEAIRRLSGVNVLNDQGEGRFVAVRGLDPNLNAASINGARVPAPEAGVRSVALDVIPAELIESIEIKKSLTPDMDGDTIGASIEIHTASALDRDTNLVSFAAEGSYNDRNGEWSPKAGLDFSARLTDRFGIAGGFSYYERKFATDNIEMDGWDESAAGIVFADTVEYRDYDVERTRIGGSLSLDLRLSDTTDLYAKLLHSKFEDQEYRARLTFEFDEAPRAGSATTAEFFSDDGEIAVTRDIKDRYEVQNITSLVLGGTTHAAAWTIDYSGAWSKAREKESGSLDPVAFVREFDAPGELGVRFDYRDMRRPRHTLLSGAAAFDDPLQYAFDEAERTTRSLSEDEEIALRVDLAREFVTDAGAFTLQFGAKSRLREKIYDLEVDLFDGFAGDWTLAEVAAGQSYDLLPIAPLPDGRAVRAFFERNLGAFELNALDSRFDSAVEDYRVDEDIHAGYVLGRYQQGPLRLIGGVRVERTRQRIAGNTVELIEEGGERDGTVLEEDTVFITPTGFTDDYTHWLPSLNVRWQAREDVVLRAAAYRSLMRPLPEQLAPNFVVEQNEDGEREGVFGNPGLDPYRAWNLDLSAEWYFGHNAVLQGGVFYKSIEDFIVYREFEDVTFNGIFATEARMPVNGERADVRGIELNYQQALSFLPAPFDGLLAGLNYTYTDATGEIDGREIPLPASAENTYNLMLGYEKGPLSVRLTAAWRDRYLDELGGSAEEDRWVEDHVQYDLSVKYRATPQLQVFAEFVNLGDEPYVAYQRGPGQARLLQYEAYSWTAKTGFRYNF